MATTSRPSDGDLSLLSASPAQNASHAATGAVDELHTPALPSGAPRRHTPEAERLLALLSQDPTSFRFFQTVRLLHGLDQDRQPIGHFAPPQEEVARFSAPPALAFPPSELRGLLTEDGRPTHIEANFFGLNTVNGPMSRASTALLLERERARDNSTAAFLDLFNHRALSLFFRAWRRYRFALHLESNRTEDSLVERLYDLVGLGTPGLRNRMSIPDTAAIFYAGLLSRQVRSAESLEQILHGYFGVSVSVQQFTGTWERLSPDQQTHLREGQSFAECLGQGTVVGDEVWNPEGALTIRLGPMPIHRYQDFLPGGHGQRELEAWLQFFSRRAFRFVVQLVLRRDDVPEVHLTTDTQAPRNRLGYETWLKRRPFRRDPDETTYILQ